MILFLIYNSLSQLYSMKIILTIFFPLVPFVLVSTITKFSTLDTSTFKLVRKKLTLFSGWWKVKRAQWGQQKSKLFRKILWRSWEKLDSDTQGLLQFMILIISLQEQSLKSFFGCYACSEHSWEQCLWLTDCLIVISRKMLTLRLPSRRIFGHDYQPFTSAVGVQ